MDIYPSILVDTFEEFERRVRLVEEKTSLFHVDVGDGVFVPHKSFSDISAITQFSWKRPFELHLMLGDAKESILPWLQTPAKRVIFHVEACQEGTLPDVIYSIKHSGKEVGLALNPSTGVGDVKEGFSNLDLVLLMSVEPGFSGQAFIPGVLEKISPLRANGFSGIIEVDGGMNEKTIPLARDAGADAVAVASGIYNARKPVEALAALKSKFKNQIAK